ncbi:ABC transporter ATP-binding protein [Streptomyces sp. NPDC004959]|uniref:ABC transporter ATP-binding protein n=1 Tax=unclassified Streptomyces TaxID=2593676 RepID=UPI000ADE2AA1|nr:ABC transporter ATP-binding protein [Streptomyces sp. NRRL F-5630]
MSRFSRARREDAAEASARVEGTGRAATSRVVSARQEEAGDGTALRVDGATVRFGNGRPALDAVDLSVRAHEVVCVLGPSGSGKSTLLRVVAGLQPLDAGSVWLGGEDQRDVPVHRRGVGLMFQDHQLFPQRDVAGNVAFGLRMRRVPADARAARVAELLSLVGLADAAHRGVGSLSGGEQQRVALARALAPRPSLLMLDEPFGQLDRTLRERLVQELRELFTALGTTVLAVTHDQGEAFALADRVVIMRDGAIAQSGAPLEVWRRPADSFVARFLGFSNLVPARVTRGAAETAWGRLPLAEGHAVSPGEHTVLVRPAGVRLVGESGGLTCEVVARTFHGTHVSLRLRPRDAPEVEATCALHEAPERGDRVGVVFDAQDVVVLD